MSAIGSRSYTVDDYHQMIEMGLLAPDDRVELLNHHIVPMVPQNPPHAATTKRNDRYLQRRLYGYADVRTQLPITLSTSDQNSCSRQTQPCHRWHFRRWIFP